jgi:conjugal transfer/type IV secretion protein DotA/TraY
MTPLRRLLLTIVLPCFVLGVMIVAAHAQAAPVTPGTITWQQLTPGTDWSSQILNDLFPLGTPSNAPGLGGEQTVIGTMIGDLNGLVMLIAVAFVAYSTIIEIHRGAETGRVLSEKTSSWSPVRMGFAAIMMLPIANGFSVGQAGVIKVAGWAIGGANTIYDNAVQAIGPQGLPITTPQIPNVEPIVAGLIDSEVCRALINDAANDPSEIPEPVATSGGTGATGFVSFNFSLNGNQSSENPTCGSLTIKTAGGAQTIDGVNVNMSADMLQNLQYILSDTIQPAAQTAANTWWTQRTDSAFAPLWGTYVTATNQLVQMMTTDASNITQQLNAASGTQGNLDATQQQMENLGWAGAGAYFWKIAQMNGANLSMLSVTPTVVRPSFSGAGPSIDSDILPAMTASAKFMAEVQANAETNDSTTEPSGLSDEAASSNNALMSWIISKLSLNQQLLNGLDQALTPYGSRDAVQGATDAVWQDPFNNLTTLGAKMVGASTGALALVGALNSSNARGLWAKLVRAVDPAVDAASATAKVVDTGVMGNFIFVLCMALLVPGLVLAFALPMIPLTMWIAGVASWFILVIEAMIAVPLWMLAHMTYQGEGFHGRAQYGYSLMFNVLFRPVLMEFGLVMGYWIFTVMTFLTFLLVNLAADFVLQQGTVFTNLLGVIVLLNILVVIESTWAVMAFKMIGQIPYQVIKWVGFTAASRVDMEQFALATTTAGSRGAIGAIDNEYRGSMAAGLETLGRTPTGRIKGPGNGNTGRPTSPGGKPTSGYTGGNDSTLDATTDLVPPSEDNAG